MKKKFYLNTKSRQWHYKKTTDKYPSEIKENINRIQQIHKKKTMCHYQLGFILKMQDWINTCKSTNAMEHINKIKDKDDMIIPFMQNKHLEKYNSLSW